MELLVFGLNHRTAPLEVRERWALSRDASREALVRFLTRVRPSEHVILSTCNRTEFYSHVPRTHSPLARSEDPELQCRSLLHFYLGGFADGLAQEIARRSNPEHFYLYRQQAAVEHLFRLAGGLDSMILGESEILHQIKEAYETARSSQTAGKLFQRLFPQALRVGKRVRTVTAISEGCITPGQAALSLAKEAIGDLASSHVLLIGSGKIASITARALMEAGIRRFTVANRTLARARELLDAMHARRPAGAPDSCEAPPQPAGAVAEWKDLPRALAGADVVISSTGAPVPIVSRELMASVREQRGGKPLAVIDLAIPRDFHPSTREIPGVRLFNIDDLNQVIQENIAKRHEHVARAEAIVHEQLSVFFGRLNYLQVDPVIRHLVERFESIRLGELQSSLDRFPQEYHEAVDEVTRRLVSKLIHFPIERLKSVRDMQGLNDTEIAFLKRLFLPQ